MADNRIPLIVNSTANQIQELPTDDNLVLNDTNKLILGTQGELEIFHNSSGNSYIKHTPPSGSNLDLRLQIGGQQFVVEKTNGQNFIVADHTVGDVALHFADGTSSTEKLTTIGTGCTVTGDIHASGKIVPSLGSGTGNGIRWPEDPGGGSGDAASITYFVSDPGTEKTTLKIAVANDGSSTNVDNIELSTHNDSHTIVSATGDASSSTTGAFRVSGGVGIGKKLFVGTEFKIGSETGSTAVDIVRDEDDMASNDPKALATQQSIKKYVDDSTSASGNALSLTADDGGTTTIIFATETLDIEGTANEIVTATGSGIAANKLRVGLTNDVTIGRDLTVTRNLTAAKATVDNIELDTNKITTTSGDLTLDATGTNDVIVNADKLIVKQATELGDSTNDHTTISGKLFVNSTTQSTSTTGAIITEGGLLVKQKIRSLQEIRTLDTTQSSNKSSGALRVDGGIGCEMNLNVGQNFNVAGTFQIASSTAVDSIKDQDNMSSNSATALATQQSIKAYADNLSSVNGDFTVNGILTAEGIKFQGTGISGNNVKLEPKGAAPVIGVRAYGFITGQTESGTYNANINGVNITSYQRIDAGGPADEGGGSYKINFTHAMPHANYVVFATPVFIDGTWTEATANTLATRENGGNCYIRTNNKTTTQCHVVTLESQGSNLDAKDFSFHIAIIC